MGTGRIVMADEAKRRHNSHKAVWITAAVVGVVALVLLASCRPLAPRSIDILAGPRGSSYYTLGERFAGELKRHGITARVVETKGALDNLTRLRKTEAPTMALAQSRIERELDDADAIEDLESLGSIAFEPLWLFVRADSDIRGIADLAGRAVAVGRRGSGSRAIADLLLEANAVADEVTTAPYEDLVAKEAADTLLSRKVDAMFLVGRVQEDQVARLLASGNAVAVPILRAETYAALFPGLARFDVLPGAVDLARNLPPQKLETLAGTTNMVVRSNLHGALVEVLIDAARDIQAQPSLEAPNGVFPSARYASLPLDPRARRFYEEGPSKLSRVLPYWAAALADQIAFVVVPALALFLTLLKIVPLLLGLQFTLRSLSFTRRLVAIERGSVTGKDPDVLWQALDDVGRESATMRVPRAKSGAYIELRQNIHDGRERILARRDGASPPHGDEEALDSQ